MDLRGRLGSTIGAARMAWHTGGSDRGMASLSDGLGINALSAIYAERWAAYQGNLFTRDHQPRRDRLGAAADGQRLYKNTRLLYKHIKAVVDFYAATVYLGDLSTDGEPLPNGSLGAIPIDPQTGKKLSDRAIKRASAELFRNWNWQQNMSLPPKFAAAMGDCFIELVDVPSAGAIRPKFVWPGFLIDIDIDSRGNIDAYTLEYRVNDGRDNYLFRKTVDGDAYRYFRDGRPFAYPGQRAVEPNPYGFVPATLDRHSVGIEPDGLSDRGITAVESVRSALYELNGFMSHALDFQRKAFMAPVIVAGGEITPAGVVSMQVTNPELQEHPDRTVRPGSDRAMDIPFWQSNRGEVKLIQPDFDLGQTVRLFELTRDGILDENPEARFYKDLREMTELSAPGAERALGDAANLLRQVRNGADTQTMKRVQMALAMSGNRVKLGDWQRAGQEKGIPGDGLTPGQRLFAPFDLDSYKAGLLDFGILSRPIIEPTEMERLEIIQIKGALATRWEMRQAGIPEEEIEQIMAERKANQPVITPEQQAAGAGGDDDEERPTEGDRGDRQADPNAGASGAGQQGNAAAD